MFASFAEVFSFFPALKEHELNYSVDKYQETKGKQQRERRVYYDRVDARNYAAGRSHVPLVR